MRDLVFLQDADPSSLSFLDTYRLLNEASSLLVALYLAVCGLASGGAFLFCYHSLSLKLAGSRSATLNLATALLSARGLHHCTWLLRCCLLEGLHHCTWRLRCCLLEVGYRYVLDLAASHRLGHLCFSRHVWGRDSFLRILDLFLKLRHVDEFPG